MLTPFVDARLDGMSREHLIEFDRLLQCDDWFLMQMIAKTRQAPPELQCAVLNQLQGMHQPEVVT